MKTIYIINGYVKLNKNGKWERLSQIPVPEKNYEKVNELLKKNGFSHFIYTIDTKVISANDELP